MQPKCNLPHLSDLTRPIRLKKHWLYWMLYRHFKKIKSNSHNPCGGYFPLDWAASVNKMSLNEYICEVYLDCNYKELRERFSKTIRRKI